MADKRTEDEVLLSLLELLNSFSQIAGFGFVIAAFFKFHQHKLHPGEWWASLPADRSRALTEKGLTPESLSQALEAYQEGDTAPLKSFLERMREAGT